MLGFPSKHKVSKHNRSDYKKVFKNCHLIRSSSCCISSDTNINHNRGLLMKFHINKAYGFSWIVMSVQYAGNLTFSSHRISSG